MNFFSTPGKYFVFSFFDEHFKPFLYFDINNIFPMIKVQIRKKPQWHFSQLFFFPKTLEIPEIYFVHFCLLQPICCTYIFLLYLYCCHFVCNSIMHIVLLFHTIAIAIPMLRYVGYCNLHWEQRRTSTYILKLRHELFAKCWQ